MPLSVENTGATATDGTAYPKRRSVRMLYEMTEEEALTRAITFLEDALGYRLVEGGGRSLEWHAELNHFEQTGKPTTSWTVCSRELLLHRF